MRKITLIITLCRIPQYTNQGTQTHICQCNQIRGKMISSTKHRKELSKEVIEYVKSMEEPVDVIIGGFCNLDVASIEVQHFFQNCNCKMCIKHLTH